MRRHTIRIEHITFVLTDEARAHDIQTAALSAMQQGGGMINVFHDDNRNVSVLVSPGVALFFTSDTIPDDNPNDPQWANLDIAFQEPDTSPRPPG